MYKPYETSFRNQSMTIREKLYNISFSYVMFDRSFLLPSGIVMPVFGPQRQLESLGDLTS